MGGSGYWVGPGHPFLLAASEGALAGAEDSWIQMLMPNLEWVAAGAGARQTGKIDGHGGSGL